MSRPTTVTRSRRRASRSAHTRRLPSTLNRKTLSFVIVEFLGATDTNALKRKWQSRRFGFKDSTPIWGKERRIYSFSKRRAIINRWPQFKKELEATDADWYVFSGHHGREFKSINTKTTPVTEAGFFNHWYYKLRWTHGVVGNPDIGVKNYKKKYKVHNDDQVYMSSTSARDNPFYSKARTKCKGVIMTACNTLSYRATRIALNKSFPDAVIIGFWGTTAGGSKSIRPVMKVGRRRSFFENPAIIPTRDLCRKLNKYYYKYKVKSANRSGGVAVMHKGEFYFGSQGKIHGPYKYTDGS